MSDGGRSLALSLPPATAEDAPNAAAAGSQPAPPWGSSGALPAAVTELLGGWPPSQITRDALLPSLGVWPPPQSTRDAAVCKLARILAGPNVFSQRYGAVPEPEASRVAAAVEAEAFAAASESAAGASLASAEEWFEVFRGYCKEIGRRLIEFVSSATAPPPAEAAASEE